MSGVLADMREKLGDWHYLRLDVRYPPSERAAIRTVFLGAAWQRCRVHFVRDVFSVIEKTSGEMVAATIRTVFAQTTGAAVRSHRSHSSASRKKATWKFWKEFLRAAFLK